jgi:hypothetical protein
MYIYPIGHNLILDAMVRVRVMPDPTEAHQFTFGCYRAVDVTLDDTSDNGNTSEHGTTSDAGTESDHALVTDGGFAGGGTCPSCESDLANVQGVPDCTHCAWNAR